MTLNSFRGFLYRLAKPLGKDWRDSPAHLLLLSKFLRGDSPSGYDKIEGWEAVLQETARKAIERFLKEGALEPAELHESLDVKFKSTDLKAMLKERGLKVSGRKMELIDRLIQNDPTGMQDAAKDITVYRCTVEGRAIAERYLEDEREKKTMAEQKLLEFLTKREFSKAARTLADYEATQVFPRGALLGVGGEVLRGEELREAVTEGTIRDLEVIFLETPGILKGIETSRLEKLRVAAGMVLLWGTNRARPWLPDDFETGINLDGDTAARMLVFYAWRKRDIESYKEMGVKRVEVRMVGDDVTCAECREISGKKYSLANAPELPYPKCTSKMGCRCSISAQFD